MLETPAPETATTASHDVFAPARRSAPVILASPHSGTDYPGDFVAASKLDLLSLRRSEDSFVDELFANGPAHGLPLLRARFPRAYIDPNREPFELDPAMFEDALPEYANTRSSRVAAGLGTIARVVSSGQDIYAGKLKFADAAERINRHYRPYHRSLRHLLAETRKAFGGFFLIDCHSMPSIGGPYDPDAGRQRADIILGDCFGNACGAHLAVLVSECFADMGYSVERNRPFAGGFTTRHYGRPREGLHALQIEINRGLYMDEDKIRPTDGLETLKADIDRLLTMLGGIRAADLRPG